MEKTLDSLLLIYILLLITYYFYYLDFLFLNTIYKLSSLNLFYYLCHQLFMIEVIPLRK